MTQSTDITLSPAISGLAQRTEINSILQAVASMHSGNSRPSYVVTDMMWLDKSGGSTSLLLKYYDGADDILLGTINASANTFTPAGTDKVLANSVSQKSSTFTVLSTERGVLFECDATSANMTANLTAGVSNGFATLFYKSDSSANSVIIDPPSSETINGASTISLTSQGDACLAVKKSSNWVGILFGNSSKLKVSAGDTTPNFLESKVTVSDGLSIAKNNAGANETLNVKVDLVTNGGLEFSSADLKVKAGTGIVLNASGVNVDVGSTANKIPQLDSNARLPAVDGRNLINTPRQSYQLFTSSGTFTVPVGITKVFVEVIGGGGGTASTGVLDIGQGGSYVCGEVDVSALSNVTVTVGAGGNTTPSDGGQSSFGTYLVAGGGRRSNNLAQFSYAVGVGSTLSNAYEGGAISYAGSEVLSFFGAIGRADKYFINSGGQEFYNNNSGKSATGLLSTSDNTYQKSFGKGGRVGSGAGQAGCVIVWY